MLLYELQLHLSAIQPRRKKNAAAASPSASHRKGAEPLTYEDIECGCCFSDISIEQATSCADGCLFCKECLSRTVQESVYGQAPLRLWRSYSGSVASVEPNTFPEEEGAGGEGTGIRCLSIEGCQASFSDKELRRCLSKELYMALETRLVEQNLQIYQAASARLKNKGGQARIVNCPFCPYVAIEDVPTVNYLWYNTSTFLDILRSLASLFTISLLYLCWLLSAIFVPELLNTSSQSIGQDKIVSKMSQERQEPVYLTIQPVAGFRAIQERIQQIFDTCLTKHNGTVFRCRNIANDGQTKSPSGTFASPTLLYSMLPPLPPSVLSAQASHVKTSSSDTCGRHSCRLCLKLHYAGHQCIDKTEGLRLVKEQAASNAIKRQCPECGLSFVKDNGCNKITCRCGYVMCFVCRKGIAGERYAHFCQHPRNRECIMSVYMLMELVSDAFHPARCAAGSACTVCTNCDLFKEEDETLGE